MTDSAPGEDTVERALDEITRCAGGAFEGPVHVMRFRQFREAVRELVDAMKNRDAADLKRVREALRREAERLLGRRDALSVRRDERRRVLEARRAALSRLREQIRAAQAGRGLGLRAHDPSHLKARLAAARDGLAAARREIQALHTRRKALQILIDPVEEELVGRPSLVRLYRGETDRMRLQRQVRALLCGQDFFAWEEAAPEVSDLIPPLSKAEAALDVVDEAHDTASPAAGSPREAARWKARITAFEALARRYMKLSEIAEENLERYAGLWSDMRNGRTDTAKVMAMIRSGRVLRSLFKDERVLRAGLFRAARIV